MAELGFQEREAIAYARKLRANCHQCSICGAVTCTGDNHQTWHDNVKQYVDNLRSDALTAIDNANGRTDQLRTDATTAIQTQAQRITALTNRVSTLETDLANALTRIAALEVKVP